VAAATPVASEFTQAVAAGTFVQAAFVDPNDPSTVYVTQVRAGRGKQGAPISLFTWACIHYLIRVARSSSVAKTIDVTSQHVNLTPCGCVCARARVWASSLKPVEQAEVPVAYPQNNLVATAVAVDPAAASGATPAIATVVDTSGTTQVGAAPPVAVATVVPSTGFQ
jgi:hypothetical protein